MTVSALEALQDSELLDKNDKVVDLSRLEPIELQKRLDHYRNTRIRQAVADAETSLSNTEDLAALISSVSWSASSTATSTSAARPHPASRSRPEPSAKTAACPSSTATGSLAEGLGVSAEGRCNI